MRGCKAPLLRPGQMKPAILISRVLPESALALAGQRAAVDLHREAHPLPKPGLIARLKDKEGLVCLITDRIDREVLAAAPRLRVVANVAVGYDNIDVAAASARRIVVTNTPDVLTETTADFAWTLLMAAARRGERRAGSDRERGGAGPGAQRGVDRRRGARHLRGGTQGSRRAPGTAPAWCWPRTSPALRSRPGSGWPPWRWKTAWRCSRERLPSRP